MAKDDVRSGESPPGGVSAGADASAGSADLRFRNSLVRRAFDPETARAQADRALAPEVIAAASKHRRAVGLRTGEVMLDWQEAVDRSGNGADAAAHGPLEGEPSGLVPLPPELLSVKESAEARLASLPPGSAEAARILVELERAGVPVRLVKSPHVRVTAVEAAARSQLARMFEEELKNNPGALGETPEPEPIPRPARGSTGWIAASVLALALIAGAVTWWRSTRSTIDEPSAPSAGIVATASPSEPATARPGPVGQPTPGTASSPASAVESLSAEPVVTPTSPPTSGSPIKDRPIAPTGTSSPQPPPTSKPSGEFDPDKWKL